MHRKYIGQIYTDSLVHDEEALKYLVSTVGEDHVILGSDYPFPLGEHHPGKLIDSIQDWDSELKVEFAQAIGEIASATLGPLFPTGQTSGCKCCEAVESGQVQVPASRRA